MIVARLTSLAQHRDDDAAQRPGRGEVDFVSELVDSAPLLADPAQRAKREWARSRVVGGGDLFDGERRDTLASRGPGSAAGGVEIGEGRPDTIQSRRFARPEIPGCLIPRVPAFAVFSVEPKRCKRGRLQVLSLCGILRRSEADAGNPSLKNAVG